MSFEKFVVALIIIAICFGGVLLTLKSNSTASLTLGLSEIRHVT